MPRRLGGDAFEVESATGQVDYRAEVVHTAESAPETPTNGHVQRDSVNRR